MNEQIEMGTDMALYLYLNIAVIVVVGIALIWLYIRIMRYLNLKIKYLEKLLDSD